MICALPFLNNSRNFLKRTSQYERKFHICAIQLNKKKNEIVLPFYEYVIIRYTEAKLILCIAQIDGLICNGIYIGNYSISRNSAYVLCNVKRPCISSSSQSVVIAISSYIYSTTRIKCSISVL